MLDPDKVGTNIRFARKRNGLTQEQLALKLGVSRQAVSKWERGEGLPDIEQVVRLANEFCTTIDTLLLGDIEERRVEAYATDEGTTDSEIIPEHGSPSPAITWEHVLERVKQHVSRPSFDTWFRFTRAEWTEGGITVYCPNRFTAEWMSSRYKGLIRKIVGELEPGSCIEVSVESLEKWTYRPSKTNLER